MRLVLIGLGVLAAITGCWLLGDGAVQAQPQFKTQFDNKYMKDENSPLSQAYGGTSSCNVCHIGGPDDRKHRNAYGQALAKRIKTVDADALKVSPRKKDPEAVKKAEAKVKAALEAVEKERSDPTDLKSPTFGELITTGKLPRSPTTLPEELKDK